MLQLSFADSHRAPVWLVEASYTIGCDETCEIFLDHPSIMAHHAKLVVEDDRLLILPASSDASVAVDGITVSETAVLKHGSTIMLGELQLFIIDPKLSRKQPLSPDQQQKLEGWYLKAKTTALANKHFEVKGPVTLGRAKECDICLGVSHLSRKHALLMPSDGGLLVEDLGSSNGTYVAGKKISGKKLAQLGDEVRFDTLSFEVCRDHEGEEKAQADDLGDVTSLRPAISADMIKSAEQVAPKLQSGVKSEPQNHPRKNRTKPPVNANASNTKPEQIAQEGSGGLQIIAGITLVSLLMLGLVFYLIS